MSMMDVLPSPEQYKDHELREIINAAERELSKRRSSSTVPAAGTPVQVGSMPGKQESTGPGTAHNFVTYPTGAKRSERKLRYDLVPFGPFQRLAARYTGTPQSGGAAKYGEWNWSKGLPTTDIYNHVVDHLGTFINMFHKLCRDYTFDGEVHMDQVLADLTTWLDQDDHLAAAAWGIFGLMWQIDNLQLLLDPEFRR